MPTTQQPPTPQPYPAHPTSPPGPPMLDPLERFWPEDGLPARAGVLLASVGVGVLAGVILPERNFGLGTFLILMAFGATVFYAAKNRRDPFTLACAVLCVLLTIPVVLRDAEWVAVPCLFIGGIVCMAGLARGRSMPDFVVAAAAWPLAGLRGMPWLGRTLRSITGTGHAPAVVADGDLVAPRPDRLRPAVRLRGRAVRRVGRRRRAGPADGHVRGAVLRHRRRRRRDPGGGLPRPEPAGDSPGRRGPTAGAEPVRVAGAGRPGRPRVPDVPGGAGDGVLRRPRLPPAHHRADLRGVRAPGLRAADRGDRADPAGGLGRLAQGVRRDRSRPALAARCARVAVRAGPGRRRVGPLPDAPLPGGLRVQPAPAAGRRLRDLARLDRRRRHGGGDPAARQPGCRAWRC